MGRSIDTNEADGVVSFHFEGLSRQDLGDFSFAAHRLSFILRNGFKVLAVLFKSDVIGPNIGLGPKLGSEEEKKEPGEPVDGVWGA